jgi:hypothetical protein
MVFKVVKVDDDMPFQSSLLYYHHEHNLSSSVVLGYTNVQIFSLCFIINMKSLQELRF